MSSEDREVRRDASGSRGHEGMEEVWRGRGKTGDAGMEGDGRRRSMPVEVKRWSTKGADRVQWEL